MSIAAFQLLSNIPQRLSKFSTTGGELKCLVQGSVLAQRREALPRF